MFMAHELSEALEIKDEIPSIAALLHDIGHMPFSHGLENEFYGLYKVVHEDLTKNIILGENPYDDSTIPVSREILCSMKSSIMSGENITSAGTTRTGSEHISMAKLRSSA